MDDIFSLYLSLVFYKVFQISTVMTTCNFSNFDYMSGNIAIMH